VPVTLGPAGNQLEQQPVDAADQLRARRAELVTAVDQQPQGDCGVVRDDLPRAGGYEGRRRRCCAHRRDRSCGLAGVEHPHSGRQFRWHVQDDLAIRDQALSDVPADPSAAFDRPHPVRELPPGQEELAITVGVGAEAAWARIRSRPSITLIVADRLCGSIPITTRPMPHASSARTLWTIGEEGNATLSWADPS